MARVDDNAGNATLECVRHNFSHALPLLGAVKRVVLATPLAIINFSAKPVSKTQMNALGQAFC